MGAAEAWDELKVAATIAAATMSDLIPAINWVSDHRRPTFSKIWSEAPSGDLLHGGDRLNGRRPAIVLEKIDYRLLDRSLK